MSSIKRFRIIKWKKDRPVLSAKSISKSYGSKMVLRKIDLELQRGEMLGFLGSNGAGKSTFMSIVLGLQKSDYGDVFLGSKKITSLPIHVRAQMGIGFLPQQSSIFRGSMTVFDNIYGIAQISRKELSNSDRRDLTENLMAEFSITHLRNVRATALSGGERRRLEICRCLITNPRVLLLDEPMAGVDLLSIQDIKSLLLKLQSRPDPVSCIISDHNASQLLKIVDRAVVLANGIIVANDSPRKLVNHPEARRLYFGKDFTSF